MITEREALVQLVLAILEHNSYYNDIHNWLDAKKISNEDFAYDIVNNLQNIIPNHSVYYFLDNIENLFHEVDSYQFNEVYEIVDYLYDNYMRTEDL